MLYTSIHTRIVYSNLKKIKNEISSYTFDYDH